MVGFRLGHHALPVCQFRHGTKMPVFPGCQASVFLSTIAFRLSRTRFIHALTVSMTSRRYTPGVALDARKRLATRTAVAQCLVIKAPPLVLVAGAETNKPTVLPDSPPPAAGSPSEVLLDKHFTGSQIIPASLRWEVMSRLWPSVRHGFLVRTLDPDKRRANSRLTHRLTAADHWLAPRSSARFSLVIYLPPNITGWDAGDSTAASAPGSGSPSSSPGSRPWAPSVWSCSPGASWRSWAASVPPLP